MAIRFVAVFDGLSVKKGGELDLHFQVSAQELSKALPIVTAARTYLDLDVTNDGTGETVPVGKVAYKALNIKAEGEARLSFESSLENLTSFDLGDVQDFVERPVVVSVSPSLVLGMLPGMTEVPVQGFGG